MTATVGAESARTSPPSATPGAAFARVVSAAIEYAVAKASHAAAAQAREGKHPVWAAVKGAWSGSTVAVRAAIVTALVALLLLAVLSPVLLLAFLLSLLVVAAVAQARRARA